MSLPPATFDVTDPDSDVIYDSFPLLYGSVPTSKNDVVKGAQWRFTGKRDTRYIFNSGNPV